MKLDPIRAVRQAHSASPIPTILPMRPASRAPGRGPDARPRASSRLLPRSIAPWAGVLVALALPGPLLGQLSADPPDPEYRVFVGSEATDRISLVVFGPEGARVEREFTVSLYPTEADGPHGLAMAPDGRHLYVTTGHGRPWGNLWKLDAETGHAVGRVELGAFPASLDVSPDGRFAFVANFNLHGDMIPSSVSVVDIDRMLEISRIETCTMPHGSRLSNNGRHQYSTCMMDDLLVEVDAWGLSVSRHFVLSPGHEHGMEGVPAGDAHVMSGAACSPTWAAPAPDGGSVWVACNRSGELVEVDVASWTLARRIPAAPGIYNLDVTSDGRRLVATNKQDHSVSVFDLEAGHEIARIPTTRRVVHGVVLSPDDRYAFISVEGVGSEPGTLEVLDLEAAAFVARVDLPPMSAGVAFWH
jgi:DNA-binding beta-propeller fold protein YncE